MATVNANGVDLRVNRYRTGPDGARPVVVFIHGLGIVDHSGLSFTLGMPLASVADVVLYAMRGHGHSEVPPAGYRLVDHVADLLALVDALAIDQPVRLVGCSYGGAVALAAAMQAPERVEAAFLVDPLVPHGEWPNRILPMFDSAADVLRGEYTLDEVMVSLGTTSRRRAASAAQRAERLLLGTTILDDLRAEPPLDAADFARIACPVEAVFGTDSEMYPTAATLKDLVPTVQLHTIVGADHLGIFSHTRELTDLLQPWAAS